MTPDWLQPMPWLQMQQKQGKSVGQGIVEGAGAIGSALVGGGAEGEGVAPPAVRMSTQTPTITEPPTPVATPPPYGAEFRASSAESPLLQQRSKILNMLMQGGTGAFQ